MNHRAENVNDSEEGIIQWHHPWHHPVLRSESTTAEGGNLNWKMSQCGSYKRNDQMNEIALKCLQARTLTNENVTG